MLVSTAKTPEAPDTRKSLRRAYESLPGNNANVLRAALQALAEGGKTNKYGKAYGLPALYATMDERIANKDVAEALLEAIGAEKAARAALNAKAEELAAN